MAEGEGEGVGRGGGGKRKRRRRRVERYRNYVVTRRLMDALILERKRLTAEEEQGTEEPRPDGIEQWVKNFTPGHFFLRSSIRSVRSY